MDKPPTCRRWGEPTREPLLAFRTPHSKLRTQVNRSKPFQTVFTGFFACPKPDQTVLRSALAKPWRVCRAIRTPRGEPMARQPVGRAVAVRKDSRAVLLPGEKVAGGRMRASDSPASNIRAQASVSELTGLLKARIRTYPHFRPLRSAVDADSMPRHPPSSPTAPRTTDN